jgi:hypothetical protein
MTDVTPGRRRTQARATAAGVVPRPVAVRTTWAAMLSRAGSATGRRPSSSTQGAVWPARRSSHSPSSSAYPAFREYRTPMILAFFGTANTM